MIKQYLNFEGSKNAIVTVAIGNIYLNQWEQYAKLSWEIYCKKYNINLFVVTENLIPQSNEKWKKPNWQKLLIGDAFKNLNFQINDICLLDTDILISPKAKNVFDFYDSNTYGLISKIKNIPILEETTLKKISFLRNRFYDNDYPLDSSLLMTSDQIYKHSGLEPQNDYACSGVILFNVKKHSEEMKSWFYKYNNNIISITGGEQTHVNWEIQKTKKVTWLAYDFQALWIFEMATKYPFLYDNEICTTELIIHSIQASLLSVNFLHFAGSWHESKMWLNKNIISNSFVNLNNSFETYDNQIITGKSYGKFIPKNI